MGYLELLNNNAMLIQRELTVKDKIYDNARKPLVSI